MINKIQHGAIDSAEITAIDSSLKKAGLTNYNIKAYRVNITKNEISTLSAEAARQVMKDIQVQALKDRSQFDFEDSLKRFNILPGAELKIAFPYIDTITNGIIMPLSKNKILDTFPIFLYKSKRNLNTAQTKQLYQYLLIRTGKDTIVMLPF